MKNKLFTRNGCLTSYAVRMYITERLPSDKKEKVEDHLRHCEMCTEAIKGFSNHKRFLNKRKDLTQLTRKIRRRYIHTKDPANRNGIIFIGLITAAVFIILIIIYLIYRYYMISAG